VTVGNRDDGSNDLLLSETLSSNELQVWFLAEHLVNVPAVQLDQPRGGSGDAHVDR
jgi:starvation-inducible DNA-binding protein